MELLFLDKLLAQTQNKAFMITLLVVLSVFIIVMSVRIIQELGLESVRRVAYKGFEVAEQEFNKGENKEKFNFVVSIVRDSMPTPFKPFITDKLLRRTIQLWFDLMKDFLDDGKIGGNKNENS